jgi:hypothetical protein
MGNASVHVNKEVCNGHSKDTPNDSANAGDFNDRYDHVIRLMSKLYL